MFAHRSSKFLETTLKLSEDNKCYPNLKAQARYINDLIELLTHEVDVTELEYGTDKTALHYLCEAGNLTLVTAVVERGASLEVRDHCGRVPAHYVAERGYLDVMKYLLKKGASLYEKDAAGARVANLLGSLLEPILQFLLRECVIERLSNAMMSVIAILETKRVSIEFLKGELASLHPESCPEVRVILDEIITPTIYDEED